MYIPTLLLSLGLATLARTQQQHSPADTTTTELTPISIPPFWGPGPILPIPTPSGGIDTIQLPRLTTLATRPSLSPSPSPIPTDRVIKTLAEEGKKEAHNPETMEMNRGSSEKRDDIIHRPYWFFDPLQRWLKVIKAMENNGTLNATWSLNTTSTPTSTLTAVLATESNSTSTSNSTTTITKRQEQPEPEEEVEQEQEVTETEDDPEDDPEERNTEMKKRDYFGGGSGGGRIMYCPGWPTATRHNLTHFKIWHFRCFCYRFYKIERQDCSYGWQVAQGTTY